MSQIRRSRNPELVLLDWSGTISNDTQIIYETNSRLLEVYGEPRFAFDAWRNEPDDWNAGSFLARKFGISKDRLYEKFSLLLGEVKRELGEPQPYEGIVELLITLQALGKRCEIISSHPQQHLVAEVGAYGLRHVVQAVHGTINDKIPAIKAAVEAAEIDVGQAVYVGDTVQDVRAAHEAGVGIVAVTYGYHTEAILRPEGPDVLVGSVQELAQRLNPL